MRTAAQAGGRFSDCSAHVIVTRLMVENQALRAERLP